MKTHQIPNYAGSHIEAIRKREYMFSMKAHIPKGTPSTMHWMGAPMN
jgi:hypothetical protein